MGARRGFFCFFGMLHDLNLGTNVDLDLELWACVGRWSFMWTHVAYGRIQAGGP